MNWSCQSQWEQLSQIRHEEICNKRIFSGCIWCGLWHSGMFKTNRGRWYVCYFISFRILVNTENIIDSFWWQLLQFPFPCVAESLCKVCTWKSFVTFARNITLDKVTWRQASLRMSSSNQPHLGKKKAEYVENIMKRVNTVHTRKSDLEKTRKLAASRHMEVPSPTHDLYGTLFGLVDRADLYWYKVQDKHQINSWRSKFLLGNMRFAVMNMWVISAQEKYQKLLEFRYDLAVFLKGYNHLWIYSNLLTSVSSSTASTVGNYLETNHLRLL